MPATTTSSLTSRQLPGSAALAELTGPSWLAAMTPLLPASVDRPWVWLSPDADDAPAILGWGRAARFTGVGTAGAHHAWQEFHDWAQHCDADPLALGSFPFSRDEPGELVVPRVALIRRAKGAPTEILSTPSTPIPRPAPRGVPSQPTLTETSQPGAEQSWHQAVGEAVAALTADCQVQKVVLSRSVELTASHPLDQARVAQILAERFPGCWCYAHDGLIGATPELLVDLRGGRFRCRVLAGTRKPAWSRELLSDPKEQREHELAVASVTSSLDADGITPEVEGPFLLELPNVTHLATDITAEVGDRLDAARMVDDLHPTAAVCGTPREDAYRIIERVETADRGRFSGPVGWMSADGSGQWGIGLRCGQFSPGSRRVRVFAGAGIMPSSDPAKEWLETGAKMEAFRSALG